MYSIAPLWRFECSATDLSRLLQQWSPTRAVAFTYPHVFACFRQALKDARKVVPTTMAMSSPPLLASSSSSSALAVDGEPSGGDRSIVSRALLPPGAGPVATGREDADAAAAEEGRNGDGINYVEKLESRAEEIMERVLGLAAFCEKAGASKELDVRAWWGGTDTRNKRGRTVVVLCCFYRARVHTTAVFLSFLFKNFVLTFVNFFF